MNFQEPQLNCILNSEDKSSQPDLFTEENTDIVDYFETGCKLPDRSHSLQNINTQKENRMKQQNIGNKAFGVKNEGSSLQFAVNFTN
jgi:hypothetical protein